MSSPRWTKAAAWWMAGLRLLISAPASAQDEPRCIVLCTPELKIEPTWAIEHLASRHRVETNGQVERALRETVFELIFTLDVPTTIPRLSLTLEAIFVPFGGIVVHPFTGAPASEAGRDEIRDNGIEIESELNIHLFDEDHTKGWVSSHVDVVDKFSPGETPPRSTPTSSTSSEARRFTCSTGYRLVTGCATWSSRCRSTASPLASRKREIALVASHSWIARARGRSRS